MKLGTYFTKLRENADDGEGISMNELARRTKVNPATPWHVEHGRPVRANTLRNLLTKGLKLKESDPQFLQAFSLWSAEQSGTLDTGRLDRGMAAARKGHKSEADRFLVQVSLRLKQIPEKDRQLVLDALDNPESLRLYMQSVAAARR